jgi:hypothetical protein
MAGRWRHLQAACRDGTWPITHCFLFSREPTLACWSSIDRHTWVLGLGVENTFRVWPTSEICKLLVCRGMCVHDEHQAPQGMHHLGMLFDIGVSERCVTSLSPISSVPPEVFVFVFKFPRLVAHHNKVLVMVKGNCMKFAYRISDMSKEGRGYVGLDLANFFELEKLVQVCIIRLLRAF